MELRAAVLADRLLDSTPLVRVIVRLVDSNVWTRSVTNSLRSFDVWQPCRYGEKGIETSWTDSV